MKIFSKMLSKKIEPQPGPGKLALDQDVEPLRRRDEPLADDTGRVNASKQDRGPLDADLIRPVTGRTEEPEVASSGWQESEWDDDDWDDDDDWGEDDAPTADVESRRKSSDKASLVSEIREAMGAVTHVQPEQDRRRMPPTENAAKRDWSEDEEFGRRAKARSQLSGFADEAEDRILEKTETQMTDRETSRRRSAMAHLKAAAQATKADRVLRHVVSRDPSSDPEEQSPYRDDLAKVVRPHSTSRPISRQVSRPNTRSPIWDQGAGDEDAALFAAAEDGLTADPAISVEDELAAAEAERLARAPIELSEEDFADDTPFGGAAAPAPEFPASRFARGAVSEPRNAFGDITAHGDDGDDDYDDDLDDDFAPRPSRIVSETVALANAPEQNDGPDEAEVRRKIWEMADEVASEVEKVRAEEPPEKFVEVSTAIAGRAGRSAGRVKTRLLGFQAGDAGPRDVFEESAAKAEKDSAPGVGAPTQFPAGWIVVIGGPGRGACFTLHPGVSQIGRGEDQAVRLDFGDTSISRNNHAAVAYDDEQGKFYLGHGGKSNLVRLNGKPVLSTEEMANGDEIRIGETALKFVALCGEDFTWASQGNA